jgi:uncharacterized coiled-coil protein SlyX
MITMNPQTYMNLKATLFDLLEEKKATDSRIAELEKHVKEKDETIDILAGKLSTVTNIADNRAEKLREFIKENRDLRKDNAELKSASSTIYANSERLLRKNQLLQDEVRVAKAQGNRKLNLEEVNQIQSDIHRTIVKGMIHQLNNSLQPTEPKTFSYNPLDAF